MNYRRTLAAAIVAATVIMPSAAGAHAPKPGKPSHHKGVKPKRINHLHVNCQEDQVAAPKRWKPGTPKAGITWQCVDAEDYVARFLAERR